MTFQRKLLGGLLLTLVSLTASARDLQVVSSIKPVELIARAIAPPGVEFTTLVPAGSSPHTYQMKVSQRRALNDANLILWMGPDLENFLTRILQGPDFAGKTIALITATTDQEHESEHEHEDDVDEHHDDHPGEAPSLQDEDNNEHGHHHSGPDPHRWLSPVSAAEMAGVIATGLIGAGANPLLVRSNLERFLAGLTSLEAQLQNELDPARDLDLFIYHGAFTPFAEHYNLNIAGVLTSNPALRPGARQMALLQETLAASKKACLLQEPQFSADWWLAMAQGKALTVGQWDPLASEAPESANGYLLYQKAVAEAVLSCLSDR